MIFAAGLGTRLQPLTNSTPKALVKLNGIPLLEVIINRLIKYNFDEIIINIHHFAGQIKDFIFSKNNFGIRVEFSDETGQLLDTGGGLKKASWFFDDGKPFLVHNVDVLSDINLKDAMKYHCKNNALATLAVRNRATSRYFLFDKNNILCGWENVKTGKRIITNQKEKYFPLAFSGIHIIEPSIYKYISENGKFSIVDVYLELAKNQKIVAYKHDDSIWFDLGRKENLIEAERIMKINAF